jgi:hypothetical protein
MRSRVLLKIGALLGREPSWPATSKKPAMPHAGFIKLVSLSFMPQELPRSRSFSDALGAR